MNQLTVNVSARKLAVGAAALLILLTLIPSMAFAAIDSQYTVKVDTGYLALRSSPAYNSSNEIGKLYTGDTVIAKEKRGGDYWWVYSPKLDLNGYVNKDYLYTATSYGDYTVKVDILSSRSRSEI